MSALADLRRRASERPGDVALRHKRRGVWHETTWAQYADRVAAAAGGLRALGVSEGSRVGLLGHNRPEWAVAELAVQALGAEPVGLDATADELASQDGLGVLVVEDEEQLDKALEAGAGERLVVVDARSIRGIDGEERLQRWSALADAPPVAPDDWAAGPDVPGLDELPLREGDQVLSFLPMHAPPERLLSIAGAVRHGVTVHFGEGVFKQDLRDVQPTVLVGPPPLWSRMHAEVSERMEDASFVKRRCYRAALGSGGLGDLLALRALREKLGLSRTRAAVSLGPVDQATRSWFEQIGRPLDVQEGEPAAPRRDAGVATG